MAYQMSLWHQILRPGYTPFPQLKLKLAAEAACTKLRKLHERLRGRSDSIPWITDSVTAQPRRFALPR
jgi:hypothetical protein